MLETLIAAWKGSWLIGWAGKGKTIERWENGIFPARLALQAWIWLHPARAARLGQAGISRHPAAGNSICENRRELARFGLAKFISAKFMMSVDLRRV
jgi:hypothetical protein